MAVTLARTAHLRGTTFALFFEIQNVGENNPVDGQIFDIHGLAQIKFFIRNTTDDDFKVLLSVKKHENTKGFKVEMKLTCKDPEIKFDFTCSEKWTELKKIPLLFKPNSERIQFDLEVEINVASTKSVLDFMYMDDDFTDFQLSTNEGSVAVHRACLAAHSYVFKRMLCGEWKETTNGRIEIQGVTLKTLQNLKQYIYLGTVPDGEGLCPLLLIATEYLIDDLKLECIIKIAHSITSENLHDVLEFSCVNNIPELTFSILKTLRAQKRDVIEAAEQKMLESKPKNKDVTEGKHELALKPINK